MLDLILSSVAPHICYGCGQDGAIICGRCSSDITSEDFSRCIWCLTLSGDTHQCRSCARLYGITGAWVVQERSGVLLEVLDNYKFEGMQEGARQLARMLAATVPLLPRDTIVTCVPTIPSHVRSRGFDHADKLAREFAKLRHHTYQHVLKRTEYISQHELSRTKRLEVAQRSFAMRDSSLQPHPVLLVDDIFTTGATLRACIDQLRAAGITEIYVAVIARQMPDSRKQLDRMI